MPYIKAETEILQRIQTANPWDNQQPTQFSICVHYKGGIVPAHALYDKRSRIQGYYIYSAADKQYRPIPDALVKLWLDGKVPCERIPELMSRIEPTPAKNDYSPYLMLKSSQRIVKMVGVVMLGLIISVLGWLLYGQGLTWAILLSAGGVILIAWYLIRLQQMRTRRKTLTHWLMSQMMINS